MHPEDFIIGAEEKARAGDKETGPDTQALLWLPRDARAQPAAAQHQLQHPILEQSLQHCTFGAPNPCASLNDNRQMKWMPCSCVHYRGCVCLGSVVFCLPGSCLMLRTTLKAGDSGISQRRTWGSE